MVISKRERHIAIGTGIVVGVIAIWSFAVSPYLDQRTAIATGLTKANQALADNDVLFKRQRELRPAWTNMERNGLKSDTSDAETQAYQAVQDWVSDANLVVANFRADQRSATQGRFQVISFHITVNSTLHQVAHLLWSMENAEVPLRVSEMQIIPRKEGTDDLQVQLTISTLCMISPSVRPAGVLGNSRSNS